MSHWKRTDHHLWGKGGAEEHIHKLGLTHTFPRYRWRKDYLSIVGPATVLDVWDDGSIYELYDGKDTYPFKTLKAAKAYGEALLIREPMTNQIDNPFETVDPTSYVSYPEKTITTVLHQLKDILFQLSLDTPDQVVLKEKTMIVQALVRGGLERGKHA